MRRWPPVAGAPSLSRAASCPVVQPPGSSSMRRRGCAAPPPPIDARPSSTTMYTGTSAAAPDEGGCGARLCLLRHEQQTVKCTAAPSFSS